MARELQFVATLYFDFDNHDELTSMRAAAVSFTTTHNGTYRIYTREVGDYHGRLELRIPVATRAEAATKMGNIDNALSGLPDLRRVNGEYLKYKYEEREVG